VTIDALITVHIGGSVRLSRAGPATRARAGRVIAQSIAWELPSEHRRAVTATHERAVLQAGGVVIRYGQLYGPGTFYPAAPPEPPRVHVDDAARQTLPALGVPPG